MAVSEFRNQLFSPIQDSYNSKIHMIRRSWIEVESVLEGAVSGTRIPVVYWRSTNSVAIRLSGGGLAVASALGSTCGMSQALAEHLEFTILTKVMLLNAPGGPWNISVHLCWMP